MPDDEAVRIFLEFERVESAIKGQYSLLLSAIPGIGLNSWDICIRPCCLQASQELEELPRCALVHNESDCLRHFHFHLNNGFQSAYVGDCFTSCNSIALFLFLSLFLGGGRNHCITALIMWVKMCPILNELAQIRNKVRLPFPAVLHHLWPSNPGVSLWHRQNRAYITALRKQGRFSTLKPVIKNQIKSLTLSDLFLEVMTKHPESEVWGHVLALIGRRWLLYLVSVTVAVNNMLEPS